MIIPIIKGPRRDGRWKHFIKIPVNRPMISRTPSANIGPFGEAGDMASLSSPAAWINKSQQNAHPKIKTRTKANILETGPWGGHRNACRQRSTHGASGE
jgi:hypothetical protein